MTTVIGQANRSFLFGRLIRNLKEPSSFLFSKIFFKIPSPFRRILGHLLSFEPIHVLVNLRYVLCKSLIPALSPVGERVVGDLRKDGIAFCHVSELGLTGEFEELKLHFASLLQERAEAGLTEKGNSPGEDFLIRLGGDLILREGDIISKILRKGQLAAISGHYLGMVPRFVGRYIWRTLPITGTERISSQRWHRDYEDTHISKIFLYLNDIGPENGPTEYIRGSNKQGALGHLTPGLALDKDGLRRYPSEEELQPHLEVLERNRVTCTAKAGTLIFVDTFGYHRGGYCKEGVRDMVIFHFATAANLHRISYRVEKPFADSLSRYLAMVFGF